jgi:hypothetical protein
MEIYPEIRLFAQVDGSHMAKNISPLRHALIFVSMINPKSINNQ